jgi:quercetin dioxygenase-like cupin family protein
MKGLALVFACCMVAFVLLATNSSFAQKKMAEATVWPAANMKWMEMKGGPPGATYADLWGHIDRGAYGSLVKLPAGIKNPLHSHTNDVKLVVLSGTFYYAPEGGQEQNLGPGSYLFVPGGLKHTSGVGGTGPCEIFQTSSGKFDFVPAEKPKM